MSTLSALIITHNEEKHIGDCIKSLQDIADEIILLDSASTDRPKVSGLKYIQTPTGRDTAFTGRKPKNSPPVTGVYGLMPTKE